MTEATPVDLKGQLAHARHELRTPVNAIIGYSEMLLEDAADSPHADFLGRLGKVQAAGKQLQALITDSMGESSLTGMGPAGLPGLLDGVRQKMGPICDGVLDQCTVLLQKTTTAELQPFRDDLNRIATAAGRFLDLLKDPFHAVAAGVTQPTDVQEVQPASAQGRGHILIVDDNDFNRDMLARLLQREQYTFEQAGHGRQALDLLAVKPFDLVLLDIMMPEIDGFEVLKRIKANSDLKHLPVIMISALDEISGVVRCIEMGAEDYLPKPFDPVLLRARLGACLEKKRLRDQELDYLRNVAKVTEVAAGMESGQFNLETLQPVGERPDALGQLARVFTSMAREVKAREQRLQMEVQQLRVEIDESRKAKQVAEITENPAFGKILAEAEERRKRRARNTERPS